jgi:hypothetical protein
MTTDRHLERDLPTILGEIAMGTYPDYIDDVLATTAQRRQRPGWTFPERWLRMNLANEALPGAPRYPRRALGILTLLAILLAAMLAFYLGGPGATSRPPADPVLGPLSGQADLNGRYSVNIGPRWDVSVSVPTGWSAGGDWVVIGPKDNDLPDGMAVRFYTVSHLYRTPSSHADGLLSPQPGPSADDLVRAIAQQPAWDATAPSDATIGGYAAKHIQLTIPQDARFDAQDGGAFYLFRDEGDGDIWGWAPGQVFDIYAVDVNGQRLVIDAFHFPGTPSDDVAAQQAVIATIRVALAEPDASAPLGSPAATQN